MARSRSNPHSQGKHRRSATLWSAARPEGGRIRRACRAAVWRAPGQSRDGPPRDSSRTPRRSLRRCSRRRGCRNTLPGARSVSRGAPFRRRACAPIRRAGSVHWTWTILISVIQIFLYLTFCFLAMRFAISVPETAIFSNMTAICCAGLARADAQIGRLRGLFSIYPLTYSESLFTILETRGAPLIRERGAALKQGVGAIMRTLGVTALATV